MTALFYTGGKINTDQSLPVLNNAATRYGIPESVLAGVFQKETNQGADMKTSSAGAVGAFQFLPSTARQYGYPLTNTPTLEQFQQQADAAAHYLSDLYHQSNGNWNTALQHYSGGGYGLAAVQQASQAPGAFGNPSAGFLGTGLNINVPNPVSGIDAIANFITNPTNWLRIGEVIVGVILIAMGLRSLTGSTTTPMSVARTAAKVIR